MQLKAGQAIILGVAALTLCGCSSGFHWPWTKTAEVKPAATDPSVAVAAQTAGAKLSPQVAQNAQLPSTQSPPYYNGNGYAPAATQPSGYGGAYPEVTPAARTASPPVGVPAGYDTASTYNASPAGGAYPATVGPPPAGPAVARKDGPYSSASAYDNPANGATPYGANAQSYGGGAPYGSTPAPNSAYPPATAPYGATTAIPSNPATTGPDTVSNRYGDSRYGSTTADATPSGAARYSSTAGDTTAATPPTVATTGGTTQSYGGAPSYGSTPRLSDAYPQPTAPYGGATSAPGNRYAATRYDTMSAGKLVPSTTSADPRRPATAPPIDNRYASGDPFAGYQNSSAPSNSPAAPPALQTATYGSQPYRPGSTGDVASSPATVNNDPGASDVHPTTFGVLAEGATPVVNTPTGSTATIATGTSDSGVKTWKPTRGSENKSRYSQRVANRQDLPKDQTVASSQGSPTTPPLNVLPAQSRYKNPLREPDSDDLR